MDTEKNASAESGVPRSLSGGQLNKLVASKKEVRRASSEMEGSRERNKRISERRVSTRAFKDKISTSLRFHRVDVEWEAGQLESVDMGAAGVAVSRSSLKNDSLAV
jgi:hypothetical protein